MAILRITLTHFITVCTTFIFALNFYAILLLNVGYIAHQVLLRMFHFKAEYC